MQPTNFVVLTALFCIIRSFFTCCSNSAASTAASGEGHRFQKIQKAEDVVTEATLAKETKLLNARQIKLETLEMNHTETVLKQEELQVDIAQLTNVVRNATLDVQKYMDLLTNQTVSPQAIHYERLYQKYLNQSQYYNRTTALKAAKQRAVAAQETYGYLRKKLAEAASMMNGSKGLYGNALNSLLATRKKLNKVKLMLYKKEATVSCGVVCGVDVWCNLTRVSNALFCLYFFYEFLCSCPPCVRSLVKHVRCDTRQPTHLPPIPFVVLPPMFFVVCAEWAMPLKEHGCSMSNPTKAIE